MDKSNKGTYRQRIARQNYNLDYLLCREYHGDMSWAMSGTTGIFANALRSYRTRHNTPDCTPERILHLYEDKLQTLYECPDCLGDLRAGEHGVLRHGGMTAYGWDPPEYICRPEMHYDEAHDDIPF